MTFIPRGPSLTPLFPLVRMVSIYQPTFNYPFLVGFNHEVMISIRKACRALSGWGPRARAAAAETAGC
jgi:hypothetical protein